MIGSARRAQPVPGFVFTGPVAARSRGTRRGGSGQRCVCAGPVPWLQAACEREPGARAEAAGAWVPLSRWGRPGTAGLPGAVMAGVCREAGAVRARRPLSAFASWVRPAVVPTPFCGSRKFWSCSRPDSQSRALASAGALAQAGGLGHQLHCREPPASSRPPALGAQPREGCAAWVAWQGSPRGTASRSPGHGRAIVSLRRLVHCFRSAVGTPRARGPAVVHPSPGAARSGAQQSSLAVTVVVLELCCV